MAKGTANRPFGLLSQAASTQWHSKKASGARALGAHQHTCCNHLKTHFKQKFRPKYAYKCLFLEKK